MKYAIRAKRDQRHGLYRRGGIDFSCTQDRVLEDPPPEVLADPMLDVRAFDGDEPAAAVNAPPKPKAARSRKRPPRAAKGA